MLQRYINTQTKKIKTKTDQGIKGNEGKSSEKGKERRRERERKRGREKERKRKREKETERKRERKKVTRIIQPVATRLSVVNICARGIGNCTGKGNSHVQWSYGRLGACPVGFLGIVVLII